MSLGLFVIETKPPLADLSDMQLTEHVDLALGHDSNSPWAFVLDADRTLAKPDTGRLVGEAFELNASIRAVFEVHGYSSDAFRLVSRIWSKVPCEQYLARVEQVASEVTLLDPWSEVLTTLGDRLPILVVTSGIPQVWRQILARQGFAHILVLGGCHVEIDDYLMNAETKRRVVEVVQRRGKRVIAAGDSLIDEAMLRQADVRVVVPDHKGSGPLRAALVGLSNVYLFGADEEPLTDFPHITASALVDWCGHEERHADPSYP
jgi:phosphoserine phosphatase